MYDTNSLEKKALDAIKKHKLMFQEHLIAYLPCSKQTYYDHNLDKSDAIQKAIEENRVSRKVKMLSKWTESDAPALQIACMKMIGSEEEAHRLNGSRQEIKHDNLPKKIDIQIIKGEGSE